MLWLLFVRLFISDDYDSSPPVLPSRTVRRANRRHSPAARRRGSFRPRTLLRPARDRPGVRQRGHRWYGNHLGLETAREHRLGGPHEEDTPSTEALGEPHGRGSQPGAHGHPAPPGQGGPPTRRGGRGEPPPGEGKASFCTRRNRADSLKHSLSSS